MIIVNLSKKYNYIIIFLFVCILSVLLMLNFVENFEIIDVMSTNVNQEVKKVYFTFDDGPTNKETEKILDILKEEDVKATFFVTGKNVNKYPEIVKREFEEGHYIANHGYSHDNKKLYQSEESFVEEVKNTDLEISKAIGIPNYCSRIFRFPNGYMSKNYKKQKENAVDILKKMGYFYIDWNCLNKDSEVKINNYQLMKNLKESSKNKPIVVVLMHDTGDVNNSSEVLRESIEYFRNNGYEFKNMYDEFPNI